MIALITGGSGCGKSVYAEQLGARLMGTARHYIATMRVCDAEAENRVRRHRAQRAGAGYATIECPLDLASAGVLPGSVALLEDVPNILANEMFEPGGDLERIRPALEGWMEACAHLLIVTNDVFSDGVRYDALTMEYMRRLAELNAWIAARADSVTELVFSLPVAIKGALPCA